MSLVAEDLAGLKAFPNPNLDWASKGSTVIAMALAILRTVQAKLLRGLC
jgi:hypothetical protein